ncbi:DUF933 domain-containing protein, partial [Actinomycetota bacterium]
IDSHVLQIPIAIQPWEPAYPVADYRSDRAAFPDDVFDTPMAWTELPPVPIDGDPDDALCDVLLDLVKPWWEDSQGKAEVVTVEGTVEDALDDNPLVDRVREVAASEGATVVVISGALEAELAGLDAADRDEMLAEYGLDEPGLHKVIRAAYDLLGLLTFFTAGEKEARAWTTTKGATAPQAAGVIHTDFAKGFIKAEVIAYDDFTACNGEAGAKEAGKWRIEGKDYVVAEGDVMLFRFNV